MDISYLCLLSILLGQTDVRHRDVRITRLLETLGGVPFDLQGDLILSPPPTIDITAAGGITVTAAHISIQGDGGAVDIAADPQIAAGRNGQIVLIEGASDTNTVTLNDGTGLHLHNGTMIIGEHDSIILKYGADDSSWEEVVRNATASEKAWGFRSQDAGTGTSYVGGFYIFNSGNNDFTSQQTLGTANVSYAAHALLVLGEDTVDDLTIRISGASITDGGVRNGSDTEDIIFSHPALANAYAETSKKWLGQITIDHISGTAKQCNWGYCKYWDNNNADFRVLGLEATWRGGANDSDPDIQLLHHKATGWTYNAGATPTPPTAIASMKTDHTPDHEVANNIENAWKRNDLSTIVSGGNGEGTIIALVVGFNKTFETGNFLLRIRPD